MSTSTALAQRSAARRLAITGLVATCSLVALPPAGWKVQMDRIESDVARQSLWKWHHINTFLSCTSAGLVRQLPGVPAD